MLDGASGTVKTVNMVEIKPKPKCCRNLFGSPSVMEREYMTKIYKECLNEDLKVAKEKYDFDICKDTPLSDRWELTTTAPEFYTRIYTSKQERLHPLKRKMELENDTEKSETESTCNNTPPVLKQTKMPNFMKKRKRADLSPSATVTKQLRL
ncbi:uncharacterized protein LOC133185347 [Saccostrea echinata]|uniref:uncharacterized protein LOC133185347 n=1 Tax=Saccostrea echinata TaxID=191078 RepID=UPI002A7FFC4F|nr:uncharacterized protein LOC133185347 [Saccostrea echinata]